MKPVTFLLVGCGVMGRSLKKAWEQAKAPFEVTVIDPSKSSFLPNLAALPEGYSPDVILFAVKPQILPQVLPLYKQFSRQGRLFVSIAAGIPLETYHGILGQEESIIRAMPNLPATIGQGVTALTSRSFLSERHRRLSQSIFEASGKALWLEEESLMNVVTALSGSGPAYFFQMVESLASAGVANGLPPDTAMALARQTAIGAGTMLDHASKESATKLRAQVTSPGGTTEAALKVLNQDNALSQLILATVKAAIHRGRELSS